MNDELKLADVRKEVMSRYMSDGLWELFLGLMLLLIGSIKLSVHFGDGEGLQPPHIVLVIVFALVLMPRLKAKITFPRIGYVDTKRIPRQSTGLFLLLLALIAAGAVGMVFLAHSEAVAADETANYIGLYFAVFVGAILSTIAWIRKAPRMHLASLLFVLVFAGLFLFHIYAGFGFVIMGGLMLILGAVTLARFLHDNPVLPPDDYEGPAGG